CSNTASPKIFAQSSYTPHGDINELSDKSQNFINNDITSDFVNLSLETKVDFDCIKITKNIESKSIPIIIIQDDQHIHSKTNDVGSQVSQIQFDDDDLDLNSSKSSISDQALSIEKVEPLYLDGIGDVNVLQTKPALALSFTKNDNNKKDTTTAVKQKLTGLENI
ncbi:hypothetical protein BB561_006853, partial [Smittium simulii]